MTTPEAGAAAGTAPPAAAPGAGRAAGIASLVLALLALLTVPAAISALGPLLFVPVTLGLSVLAVVFGAIGRRRARRAGDPAGPALAGLILGTAVLVLTVAATAYLLVVLAQWQAAIGGGS